MVNVLQQHIESSSEVMGGKACIAGHRIRVLDVVIWHEKRGLTADEVVSLFPSLTLADVYAALAYYFDRRDEIEADIQGEGKVVAALKASFPSKLQQKLNG